MWNKILETLDGFLYTPLRCFRWLACFTLITLLVSLPPMINNKVCFFCSTILFWGLYAYIGSWTLVAIFLILYHAFLEKDRDK